MSSIKRGGLTGMMAAVAVSLAFFANSPAAHASAITPERMVELTNESRGDAGLNPLTVNMKLALAAKEKADDMFAKQYFEHNSPDGTTPWYWFNAVGYDYMYAAENLAIDFTTAEGAHSAFMKSTGHRENILGANYKEVGIAVVSGRFNGKDSIIIVEEFGTTRFQDNENEPFFEIPARSTGVKSESTVAPVSTVIVKDNKDLGKESVPVGAVGQNDAINKNEQDDGARKYGRIVPEIFAVKDPRQLKKVYTDNIYWKKADRDGMIYYRYMSYGKAKLKYALRGLTNGHCCNAD